MNVKNNTLFFCASLAALMLAVSCPPEDNGGTEAPVAIPAELMGMVHAGYHDRDGQGNSGRLGDEYNLLNELGVVWMLRDFSWDDIEPRDNDWQWGRFDQYVNDANSHNKKILGLLAYEVGWIHGAYNAETGVYACGHTSDRLVAGEREVAAFCEYVQKTVERYNGKNGHGKVDAWCIWNEPNLQPRFWTGTQEEFFTLTKEAAAAFREVDTDAALIGGALNTLATTEWVEGLFTSGAMRQVDAVAYHPYTPDAAGSFEIYNAFKSIVSKYGFGNRIWITEVGYPMLGSYGTEVAEEKMPLEVTKTITLLASGGAQRIL